MSQFIERISEEISNNIGLSSRCLGYIPYAAFNEQGTIDIRNFSNLSEVIIGEDSDGMESIDAEALFSVLDNFAA